MIHENSPALVVMIGPAACGKSTLAAALFQSFEVINLDTIRRDYTNNAHDQTATDKAVEVQFDRLDYRLGRGLTTCVDSTNVRPVYRAELLAIAALHLVPAHAIAFDTPVEDCQRQNRERRDRGGMFVPPPVIDGMYERLHETAGDDGPVEGFDVTRRLGGPLGDRMYGTPTPPHLHAPWLC